ncbi:Hypothetical protein Minf_2087 [Methylacidiphilum infernorum V4]|uniref:Uncharacterized protein n=1 Tax=Methylacidiphilum infernorum (isolate V4) TaxID=481448 RepID=B3DZ49_METI4|nr:Hypothetical protein Minf_2087 [Methylacidiphilum infernorum V4]
MIRGIEQESGVHGEERSKPGQRSSKFHRKPVGFHDKKIDGES